MRRGRDMRRRGFTLIELLVVLAIIASLLSVATLRYFASLDRARETALKQDLYTMREAIQKYNADKGRYPESLGALVADRYLRSVPVDPVTDSAATWIVVPPKGEDPKGIADVLSGAPGNAQDGTPYASW
jgi:general secretion pathway protein G